MAPEARITHQTANRLRIKIPACRGDRDYFNDLAQKLTAWGKFERIEVNPATASILFVQDKINTNSIIRYAAKESLFVSSTEQHQSESVADKASGPFKRLNGQVKQFTDGELDLPALIFCGLLLSGFYQIFKGRFGPLPWYSAFWYAFGLYTKSLADKKRE